MVEKLVLNWYSSIALCSLKLFPVVTAEVQISLLFFTNHVINVLATSIFKRVQHGLDHSLLKDPQTNLEMLEFVLKTTEELFVFENLVCVRVNFVIWSLVFFRIRR